MKKTVLSIKDLSKSFKNHTALRGINFQLKEGEILGFLGPSGAGKTTTIKIITGQLRPTKGESVLLGQNSNDLTNAIYRQVGIVTDNSGVYEKISVWENLKLYADLLEVPQAKVTELLKRVGLYEQRKNKAGKLSKGQKQRLILVRALLHEPKVLFLDEPTSGLDPATTLEIHRLLEEMKAKGMAIFLTTHDMEEATRLCDQVALLNDGEIVEYGTPTELSLKYYDKKAYTITLDDNSQVTLDETIQDAHEMIFQWLQENRLVAIHSSEPSLEKVFLSVTGRELA